MAHSIRGRQGCRPLRSGWLMVRTGGGTHRCRPTNTTDCPAWFGGRVRRPWGLRPGGSARCGGRFGTGISRRARCGCFAGCGQQVFRPLRRATGGAAPWTPRFGQRAAGWQEVSARNFASEQGAALQPYWMYGKKLHRSYGTKGPATPADTPVASCHTEKNRVKLLDLGCGGSHRMQHIGGIAIQPR